MTSQHSDIGRALNMQRKILHEFKWISSTWHMTYTRWKPLVCTPQMEIKSKAKLHANNRGTLYGCVVETYLPKVRASVNLFNPFCRTFRPIGCNLIKVFSARPPALQKNEPQKRNSLPITQMQTIKSTARAAFVFRNSSFAGPSIIFHWQYCQWRINTHRRTHWTGRAASFCGNRRSTLLCCFSLFWGVFLIVVLLALRWHAERKWGTATTTQYIKAKYTITQGNWHTGEGGVRAWIPWDGK